MPQPTHYRIIIEGVTPEGRSFRPRDWAQRLCGHLATIRNHRMVFSPLLVPSIIHGHSCIIVDSALKEKHPELYENILEFAKVNKLKIDWGRDHEDETPD